MSPPILKLPSELLFLVFTSFDSLSDVHSFIRTYSFAYEVFKAGPPTLIYDAVLRRKVPAYGDALRAVRAAATAFDYLIELGFDNIALASIAQPPHLRQALADPVKLCRFDVSTDQYVNVPTSAQIIKLSESPLANAWELRGILNLYQLVLHWLGWAQSGAKMIKYYPVPEEHEWFSSIGKGAGRWSSAQEERFFRGAFRLLLFGYLFYPGVYLEPIINQLDRKLPGERDFGHKATNWYKRFGQPKCPIYPVNVNDGSPDPRRELFGGFTEWVVEDGQRRGREENLQDNHHHPPSYGGLDMGHDGTPLTSGDRGGLRELLLFHTIFLFLGDLIKFPGSLVKYTDQKGCVSKNLNMLERHWLICTLDTVGTKPMPHITDTVLWSLPSYVTTSPSPTSPTNLAITHLRGTTHLRCVSKCCGNFVDLALLQHYYAKVPGRHVLERWGREWEEYNQFKAEGGAVLDLGWRMLKRANDRSFDYQ